MPVNREIMKASSILIFLSLFFALSIIVFGKGDQGFPEKRPPFYFAPPEVIRYFSFGFSEVYADILWMRLIQDIDFCSSKKGLPVYDGKTKYQCDKGWSFKITLAIIELAPRFLRPYEISGSIMSVIMGDQKGAKIIYDKAVERFPDNWQIHFNAGAHYLLELKEEERAAELLIRSADLGGPYYLYGLAAKVYGEMGKLLLAREVLLSAMEKDIEGTYKKAMELRLEKVQKKITELQNAH